MSVVAGFACVQFIPALSTLVALALIARGVPTDEWTAVAVGTSVGGFGALVVQFGWRLTGPPAVAAADGDGRRRLYLQSLADRAVLGSGVVVLVSLTAMYLGPDPMNATLVAIATTITGMSSVWFWVGTGEPWTCLAREIAPRALAVLAAGFLIAAGQPTWFYPVLMGLGTLFGVGAVTRLIMRGGSMDVRGILRDLPGSLRRQGSAASAEIAAGTYSVACVAVVSLAAPVPVVAVFAAGDRLFRATLIPVSVLTSALQNRVASAGAQFRTVARQALMLHALLGVSGGLIVAATASTVSELLFGADLRLEGAAPLAYGLAFLAVSLSSSMGRHVLATLGSFSVVLWATTAGSLVGLVAMVVGARAGGVTGAAFGLASGEAMVTTVLALALWRMNRGSRQSNPNENADSRS